MAKIKRALPWLLMGFFAVLGLVMLYVFSGYQFSGFLCFGIVALILCFWLLHRFRGKLPKLTKILTASLIVCLSIGFLAAVITGGFIISTAVAEPQPGCQYLIVLGCGVNGTTPSMSLRERINGAYAYLTENPDTICIVSGGQGGGEDITEAECMYRELTAMGIDPARIWQENQSTSTVENLRFSLALIEEKTGSRPATLGITSSEYHLFRAGLIADSMGVTAVPIPAATQRLPLRINYFLREIAAIWYYTLFVL